LIPYLGASLINSRQAEVVLMSVRAIDRKHIELAVSSSF